VPGEVVLDLGVEEVGQAAIEGGDVIHGFAFIMTVGVLVGTYSSIYIASPFALLWEQWFGSSGGRRRTRSQPAAAPSTGPKSTPGGSKSATGDPAAVPGGASASRGRRKGRSKKAARGR